jgi:hypothetical protein
MFQQWADQVCEHGIPKVGPMVEEVPEFAGPINRDKKTMTNFAAAFLDFFARWRLKGLAAPGLPIPLQPLMAGVLPAYIVRQLDDLGGIFFFPDTFPIPSRDELRWLLEDAIHGSDNPEHLSEWMQIVRASNLAKNKIGMYARVFKLQHYWRILQQRHAKALQRRTGKLKEVLASFLGVKAGLIHQRSWSAPIQAPPTARDNTSPTPTARQKRKHK